MHSTLEQRRAENDERLHIMAGVFIMAFLLLPLSFSFHFLFLSLFVTVLDHEASTTTVAFFGHLRSRGSLLYTRFWIDSNFDILILDYYFGYM